ncbi:hypothetical protein [Sphingobacterium daejeonense]|uniref:hypothetical protein n=1 Tax=Sphingobacterium daejeonense TaxID=371142 RepID=UPI0010C24842|nr:hypothetical protein [Sphingobacterium daejeonense]VTP91340.1 Uncharacterised protein [Sphingobacterium daejeonense]
MEDLKGKIVMVDPSLHTYFTHGLAQIGIVTDINLEEDVIEVEFENRWTELYPANALRTMKPYGDIIHDANTKNLNFRDTKILFRLILMGESGVQAEQFDALAMVVRSKKSP